MLTRFPFPGVAAVLVLTAGATLAHAQQACHPVGPPVVIYLQPYISPVPTPVAVRPVQRAIPQVRTPAVASPSPKIRPAAGFATPRPATPPTTEGQPPRIEIETPSKPSPVPVGPVQTTPRPANPLIIPLGPTVTPRSPEPPPTIPPITPGNPDGNTLPPLKLPTSPADSTSFARPLANDRPVRVDVFPVAGTANDAKSIGFFNTTDRELTG